MLSNATVPNREPEVVSNKINEELINDSILSSYVFSCIHDMDAELDVLREMFSKIDNRFQAVSEWSRTNRNNHRKGSFQSQKDIRDRIPSAA